MSWSRRLRWPAAGTPRSAAAVGDQLLGQGDDREQGRDQHECGDHQEEQPEVAPFVDPPLGRRLVLAAGREVGVQAARPVDRGVDRGVGEPFALGGHAGLGFGSTCLGGRRLGGDGRCVGGVLVVRGGHHAFGRLARIRAPVVIAPSDAEETSAAYFAMTPPR